jgi:hypothetical protein
MPRLSLLFIKSSCAREKLNTVLIMNKQGVFLCAAIAVLINRKYKAKAKGEAIIKLFFVGKQKEHLNK